MLDALCVGRLTGPGFLTELQKEMYCLHLLRIFTYFVKNELNYMIKY